MSKDERYELKIILDESTRNALIRQGQTIYNLKIAGVDQQNSHDLMIASLSNKATQLDYEQTLSFLTTIVSLARNKQPSTKRVFIFALIIGSVVSTLENLLFKWLGF